MYDCRGCYEQKNFKKTLNLSIQSISYDAMGNPTSYLGKALSWEGKQLTGVTSGTGSGATTIAYAYDENGLRTQKTVNGTTTNYYYNGSVLIGMVTGTGATAIHQLFSYDASGSVVSVDYSSDGGSTFTTYYYLRNAQNDVISLIDGTGATVVQYTYDSWGKPFTPTSTLATSLGQDQPFRYRGYVYDVETQWYYLQSRYYDPVTCRFISADVLLSTGQGVPGHNAFSYCLNNPVNMSDESGCIGHPVSYDTTMADGIGAHGSTDDLLMKTAASEAFYDNEEYHYENWKNSSIKERKNLLLSYALELAEIMQIDSYKISFGVLSDGVGMCTHDDSGCLLLTITISDSLLGDSKSDWLNAFNTLVHEMRHAYQFSAIYGSNNAGAKKYPVGRSTIDKWSAYHENYDTRPIEDDACLFADFIPI